MCKVGETQEEDNVGGTELYAETLSHTSSDDQHVRAEAVVKSLDGR